MKKYLPLLFLTVFCLSMSSCNSAYHSTHPALVKEKPSATANEAASHKITHQNRYTASLGRTVDPWPATPPQIGKLVLKQEYWHYMKEAARKYQVSPYLIQAVAAIESRYNPQATSGRGQCIGLMQLHRSTAKKYGVDPHNPRENIMGGAAVLARLLKQYDGNLLRVLRVYNAESTRAYEREVLKAYAQAMTNGAAARQLAKNRN